MLCLSHLKFRFQPAQMYFGIIDQLQCHEKIGNIRLICLRMHVGAICIPICLSVKYLRIWISNDEMPAV